MTFKQRFYKFIPNCNFFSKLQGVKNDGRGEPARKSKGEILNLRNERIPVQAKFLI